MKRQVIRSVSAATYFAALGLAFLLNRCGQVDGSSLAGDRSITARTVGDWHGSGFRRWRAGRSWGYRSRSFKLSTTAGVTDDI